MKTLLVLCLIVFYVLAETEMEVHKRSEMAFASLQKLSGMSKFSSVDEANGIKLKLVC